MTECDVTQVPFSFAFAFDEPYWRKFPQAKHDELSLAGNELWHNKSIRAGALVCSPSSRYPEIAVSKAGLDYLAAAVDRGDLTIGEVVFWRWEGRSREIIKTMKVGDVVAALKSIPPREGHHGPYWWWNRDGTPYEDAEVPY